MPVATLKTRVVLERIDNLQKEMEFLKRDFIHSSRPSTKKTKFSLYGSIKGEEVSPLEDVTEEAIEKAKQSLFRSLEDI